MMLARWVSLARKALRRPPRYVLARVRKELERQAFRPWSRIRPRLLTDRALLRMTRAPSIDTLWKDLAEGPFFVLPGGRQEWSRRFLEAFPEAKRQILEAAEAVLRHEFDFLGSGRVALGDPIPWHEDFKTGRRWPLGYWADIDYNELDRPSDVKVPWELSRCQHFSLLGEAYWLTGDERFAEEFVAQVTDWIRQNPWAYGINWVCPMDVALRAISWIWSFYFFADSSACQSPKFRSLFLKTLWLHGEFVAANVEASEVNGNHYLVDGVGLLVLGLFLRRTRRGRKWLEIGKRITLDEIMAQVTDDGVDFEQSVAYHRLVLETFLTAFLLLRRHGEVIPGEVWNRLERMHEFVAAYTKPNGQAPLIGDSDDGRIQKLGLQPVNDHRYLLSTAAALFKREDFKQASGRFWEESFWLLGPEGLDAYQDLSVSPERPRSAAFPAGGFYVMRGEDAHLIVDCGEVGLRGRGGHGHNDILSFELFLNGVNLVTDCGAYLYTASREWRDRFRSTAFHNTVQVDGEELNRFVGPEEMWRLHYDAIPAEVIWRPGEAYDYFRGGHMGYTRLSNPVIHWREIFFDKRTARALFRDRLEGRGVHHLVWRFHLDPAVRADALEDGVRLSSLGADMWFLVIEAPPALEFRLDSGWVSPNYGVKLETSVIRAETTTEAPAGLIYLFTERYLNPEERTEYASLLTRLT